MQIIQIVAYSSELIAAIISIIFITKYNNTALKYFTLYLWYVVFHETFGYFLLHEEGINAYPLFNTHFLITGIYVIWVTSKHLAIKKYIRIIRALIILMLTIGIIDNFLYGFYNPWQTTQITMPILGIIAFTYYLIDSFKKDTISNPFNELFTYFLLGFLVYFIALPVITLARIYSPFNFDLAKDLSIVMSIIAICMYLIFSFGFIWSKKKP